MQRTLVPRRGKSIIPSRFIPMPQKPGSLFQSLGRWNYVTLTRTARRIPETLAKQLKTARRARMAARVLVTTIKTLALGAAGIAFGWYVLAPVLDRIITAYVR